MQMWFRGMDTDAGPRQWWEAEAVAERMDPWVNQPGTQMAATVVAGFLLGTILVDLVEVVVWLNVLVVKLGWFVLSGEWA